MDIPKGNGSSKPCYLEELIIEHFKPERVEGYNCMKCSLREYLLRYVDNASIDTLVENSIKKEDIQWNLKAKTGTLSEKEQFDMSSALSFML